MQLNVGVRPNIDILISRVPVRVIDVNWQAITTQADADAFMTLVNEFHDGCLREAHVWTEHWVSEELSMAVGVGLDTRVRLLVQRQRRPFSAIEFFFEGVTRFSVTPSSDGYMSIIDAATLRVSESIIYWADVADWRPDQPSQEGVTWIAARRLRWRDASPWMGSQLRYGARAPVAPSA